LTNGIRGAHLVGSPVVILAVEDDPGEPAPGASGTRGTAALTRPLAPEPFAGREKFKRRRVGSREG
jgi:hypothetical protein